jgi:hypothetical protein
VPTSMPNFYENLVEAKMRLEGTVVLYDGSPFHVLKVVDGWDDQIFRVMLVPIYHENIYAMMEVCAENGDPWVKDYLATYIKSGEVLRKHMNSPLFNRFRPFPLGMLNNGASLSCYYLQRCPARIKEQGLLANMVNATTFHDVTKPETERFRNFVSSMNTKDFENTVCNVYPTLAECAEALSSGLYKNTSAAFCRDMALVVGPMRLLLLAYHSDIVGFYDPVVGEVKLCKDFAYLQEAIYETNFFKRVGVE